MLTGYLRMDLRTTFNFVEVNIVSNFKFSQDWELLDSITPPFECFSNGVTSSKIQCQKKMKIKKNTSLLPKAGQKVSMYQCWKEKLDTIQWAPYRLSLLFPKFKALQFHDLESRIRANFCAVPPPPKNVHNWAAVQTPQPAVAAHATTPS